ncbi:MAG: M20/M25/M40 family metallo-hydrolase [Prevotella sp.]|nr:M20/M25/M40 family metallo-hydrolase [Prevotella sp.]
MKRRNSYIASTLVLALVLMVGFPTSARPQVLKGFIKGVVKRLNSPAKTSAIALVGARKVDAYAKKRIEQQRRRAVRPVVIPPSVQAKLMAKQMSKLRASHNIAVPRPKVKPVAQSEPHPQLPKTPRPKPVNAVKAAQPAKAAPAPDPKAAKEKKRKKTIETIIRRFTTYATINSQSWDAYDPTEFPISDGQEEIAELIEQELRTIGSDKDLIVSRSDYQYVYATIPANCEGVPSIMFMAHMDCTPECAGGEITPIVHRNYDGGDIQLPAGITLSPETPQGKHLANCVGKTIITSDGYTLLGADDKTGCTILVTLIETILNDKKLKHGNLHFVFSQNEDIGRAAERFEEEYVDGQPDIVIDVDGDAPTAFSVENFTAVGRNYTFQGKNAHPGNGFYNQYGDALTAASYFIGQLPPETHPSASKGKEGYIHCYSIEPLIDVNGEETPQNYLVKVRLRYFDAQEGDAFRQLLDEAAELTAKAFPYVVTEAEPEVMQYENVAYTMYPGLGDLIIEAAEKEGVKLTPRSERGGTTAAMLAAKGQKGGPCLYSGQQAEHSIYEWTCAEDMYQMVMVARSIIETVANQ